MRYKKPDRERPPDARSPFERADWAIGSLHDAVSQKYYDGEPFERWGQDFGVMDEETFRDFEAALSDLHVTATHLTNQNVPEQRRIPEDQYRFDEQGGPSGSVSQVDLLGVADQRLAAFGSKHGADPEVVFSHPQTGRVESRRSNIPD